MWSERLRWKISRAAAFNADCSLRINQCAVPVVQPLVDKGNRQRLATLKTVGNRHTLVLEAI